VAARESAEPPGRPAVAPEVRELIQARWQVNPTWGSPRIVGARRKVGIDVAQSTVATSRPPPQQPPSPAWTALLHNHVQDLVALDCLVGPTVTHTGLLVLVMLAHQRRRLVPVHITAHPTAEWTTHQVTDAFPWDKAPRYLRRDQDRIDSTAFRQRMRPMGIGDVRIAPRSPWQNPSVERLTGSIRRACLDHVMVLHERQLQRLLTAYCCYYHHWRTHRALARDGPVPRPGQRAEVGPIRAVPEVGGWQHHDERQVA
jgi:putative transposase